MNNIAKSIAIWIAVALVLMMVFNQFGSQSKVDSQMVYSQFMQEVKDGRIAKVQIDVLCFYQMRMGRRLYRRLAFGA